MSNILLRAKLMVYAQTFWLLRFSTILSVWVGVPVLKFASWTGSSVMTQREKWGVDVRKSFSYFIMSFYLNQPPTKRQPTLQCQKNHTHSRWHKLTHTQAHVHNSFTWLWRNFGTNRYILYPASLTFTYITYFRCMYTPLQSNMP